MLTASYRVRRMCLRCLRYVTYLALGRNIAHSRYVIFEPVWANLLKIVTPKIMREC
jgi:hypothetical protein